MQFEITYLPRGCLESTNKIGNVGESSYYRIEFQFDKYQQAEKDRNIYGSYAWNKKVRRTISAITKRKEYIPLP